MDPIFGGGIVFGILWIIAALTGREKPVRRREIPPEMLPPAAPSELPARVIETPQEPGIQWGGRMFTEADTRLLIEGSRANGDLTDAQAVRAIEVEHLDPGGGAWRDHVRHLYSLILSDAAKLRTALSKESETALHLMTLNDVHKAFTTPESKLALSQAASREAA